MRNKTKNSKKKEAKPLLYVASSCTLHANDTAQLIIMNEANKQCAGIG